MPLAAGSASRGEVDGLAILSREDHPDMPPLNTEEGRRWLDVRIVELGGVGLIIFDNVMSLTIGDLRETDSWAAVRPYIKALQRRRIGQLWCTMSAMTSHAAMATRRWSGTSTWL